MAVRRATRAHRLEYLGFRVASLLARALPERAAVGFGALLGEVAYRLVRIRREEVERHLALAFPDWPPGWRQRVARESYCHLGREGVAVLRLAAPGAKDALARAPIAGYEVFERAVGGGRGAMVLSGHLGNWEVGAAALAARGVPLDVVVRGQGNPLFDRELRCTRERLGMQVIDQRAAAREVVRSLRAGRVVAMVGDQDAGRRGLFVDFFGMPASTARGPALLALRAGAPVFLGVALRAPAGPVPYDLRLVPLEVERTGVRDEDVRRLTEAYTRGLEALVREAPGQYFWHHRRWKSRPVQELRWGHPV